MALKKLNKKQLIMFFSTLAFLFLFLNDHTVYSVFFEKTTDYFLIIAVIFATIAIFLSGKLYASLNYWGILFIWGALILMSCLSYGLTSMVLVRFSYWIFVAIVISVLYVQNIDYKKCFYNICKVFCVWGLLCYFYEAFNLSFLPVTHVSDNLLYNWFEVELYGFIISKPFTHISIGSLSLLRLDRPFGEPGIAQMYFNFGLLYCLFINSDKKHRKLWIFLFSISTLLSFSLIGYVIFFFIIISYCVYKKRYSLLLFLSIIASILMIFMIVNKMDSVSYEDRTQDFVFMFETIFNNLPLGIGLGNTDTLQHYEIASTGQVSIGFYCGLLYPFAQFGIFGIIYYIALAWAIKYFSKNKYTCFAFAAFILFTLLTEPQADEPIIVVFLFDALIRRIEQKKTIKIGNQFINNTTRGGNQTNRLQNY
ncbi:MAG: hypothetical protein ACI4MN_02320 [Candidatus Coproplasma sp.]